MSAEPATSTSTARGEVATRRAVTWMGASAIALCFVFSFGNVWKLARHFHVPAWIAPVVGPLVDLSAVGLVIGLRHLSLAGVPGRQLRPARLMLFGCGIATWALNTADALWLRHDYGAAAFDSIAPALLVGWAEVFPWFLRKFAELTGHEIGRASCRERV